MQTELTIPAIMAHAIPTGKAMTAMRLRQLRAAMDMTQADMAAVLGTIQRTVSLLELGATPIAPYLESINGIVLRWKAQRVRELMEEIAEVSAL